MQINNFRTNEIYLSLYAMQHILDTFSYVSRLLVEVETKFFIFLLFLLLKAPLFFFLFLFWERSSFMNTFISVFLQPLFLLHTMRYKLVKGPFVLVSVSSLWIAQSVQGSEIKTKCMRNSSLTSSLSTPLYYFFPIFLTKRNK